MLEVGCCCCQCGCNFSPILRDASTSEHYFPPDWVEAQTAASKPTIFKGIISAYFSFTTINSTASLLFDAVSFSPNWRRSLLRIPVHPWLQDFLETKVIDVSPGRIVCFIGSSFPVILYFVTRHWILNNIFAILFSIVALKSISLSSMKTGLVLLWALFFYDIFWVYGTDVMVTVAKNLDIPIKILFPYLNAEGEFKTSMVGLGDIVIPGVFVSLCLKLDIHRFFHKNQATSPS
ncbi:unnamed protein product [Sphagnum balticum]